MNSRGPTEVIVSDVKVSRFGKDWKVCPGKDWRVGSEIVRLYDILGVERRRERRGVKEEWNWEAKLEMSTFIVEAESEAK